MKYLVIGKVPPPVGGVTTFTKRHSVALSKNAEVRLISDFSLSKIWKLPLLIIFGGFDRIYIHSLGWPILLLSAFSRSKTIVFDHNHSARNFKRSALTWYFKSRYLSKFYGVHIVSDHLRSFYSGVDQKNISIADVFFPPTNDEMSLAKAPRNILEAVSGRKVIVCSAWRLIFEDGNDLYGFDRAIDVFEKVVSLVNDVKLVLCVGDIGFNSEYLEYLKDLVEERSLDDVVIFWEGCEYSWALFNLEKCIYFRPTYTDGNSVSVHEANFFGAKVLASNVVPRPSFCYVYEYHDNSDAVKKLECLLSKL